MSDEWILNPHARLQPITDEVGRVGYRVFAPARNGGAQDTMVYSREMPDPRGVIDPPLVEVLDRMHSADGDVELTDEDLEGLSRIKVVISPDEDSAPAEYVCLLDPRAAAPPAGDRPDATALVLDPSLVLTPDFDAPPHGIVPEYFSVR